MATSGARVDGCSLLSATLMPSHITAAAPCWAISLSLAHKCIAHRSPVLHDLHFAGALLGRNLPPSQQCGHQVSEALCHQRMSSFTWSRYALFRGIGSLAVGASQMHLQHLAVETHFVENCCFRAEHRSFTLDMLETCTCCACQATMALGRFRWLSLGA